MKAANMLRRGKVGVIPTDTLYGIVAAVGNEQAVERVYSLKKRGATKPCIILIASLGDLNMFGVTLTKERRKVLSRYWPGPTSIILACGADVPEYLHRGGHTLAFRLPSDARLRRLLKASGPLIAPSANPEGSPPVRTIEEAKKYFGRRVDFYLDAGTRTSAPSTLIALDEKDSITVLRKGR
jgi:L-threonylcarbamoyladenylate synthase